MNQIGTPVDVFDKPVNLFVAGFIGMRVMNFFDDCKLLLEGDVYIAEIRGERLVLSGFQQKVLKHNKRPPCDIVAGIRPQHIKGQSASLMTAVLFLRGRLWRDRRDEAGVSCHTPTDLQEPSS